mgnify:CR=1 FL=1|jgi:hypothetical protein
MDIAGNRKAVVIHVPYRLRKAFKKIHVRLVRELEKKFSGKVNYVFPICLLCCIGRMLGVQFTNS